MGWETSDRKFRLPDDWPVRRLRILKRDGYRCCFRFPNKGRCPARATDVDHIIAGDDHSDDNLQSLCSRHHAMKSSQEGVAAREVKRQSAKRKPEAHPGAL